MLGIGLSLTGRLRSSVSIFSPVSLFSSNEPGIWLDPSDVANLAWRRNLLTFTEQFDNAAWSDGGQFSSPISANASNSPIATMTADRVTLSSASNGRGRRQDVSGFSSASAVVSVWVKAADTGSATHVRLTTNNTAAWNTGQSVKVALTTTWQRISLSGSLISSGSSVRVVVGTVDVAGSVDIDCYGDVLIWGAQLELGSVATDYQRISDVNTEVIERFPSATLYQDPAGTIPVTSPAQTVGLALDKSKGLVLGSELVSQDFTTYQNAGSGVPFDTFTATVSSLRLVNASTKTAVASTADQIAFDVGKTYRLTFTVSFAAGSFVLSVRDSILGATIWATQPGFNATGTYTVYIAPTSSTIGVVRFTSTSVSDFTLSALSVKELPGFHATQATLASRPTYGIVPLGGRRNLLTRTEEFGDAAWTKNATSSISVNSALAPNGTLTADTYNQTSGSPFLSQAITLSTAGAVTASIRLKKSVGDYIQFFVVDTATLSNGFSCWVNLQTEAIGTAKAVGTGGTFTSATIFDLGSGWQEVKLSGQAGTATNISLGLMISNADNSNTRLNPSSVFIWGAQLETGSSATAYQRVGSAFDVTEAGVASLSYLSFDGVDDFLITPTITPGIDKAQVFAGVRHSNTAATGAFIETSTDAGSNAGSLAVYANTTSYSWRAGGTTRVTASGNVTPPITNVLTGIGDIAGDLATLRINGTQAAQSTADQGTGNYLAYLLYIGRRAGTSLPFNGQIYSLLVRFGTNLDAGTITSTETWVNGKTGAYA